MSATDICKDFASSSTTSKYCCFDKSLYDVLPKYHFLRLPFILMRPYSSIITLRECPLRGLGRNISLIIFGWPSLFTFGRQSSLAYFIVSFFDETGLQFLREPPINWNFVNKNKRQIESII